MLSLVGLPFGADDRILLSQGSPPAAAVGGAGVNETASVGDSTGVLVGGGVCVGGSVGGKGVAVGMAACVSATMVKAAATAVFCTSAGLIVGSGAAPQAVTIIEDMTMIMEKNFSRFILLENLLVWLAVRITPALSNDTLIPHDQCRVAFPDGEATEYFEVFLAVYKCGRGVLPLSVLDIYGTYCRGCRGRTGT